MQFSFGEILGLTHGFLGILLIVGLPWAMAEILALSNEAGVKRLKMVTLGITIASYLSCIILAAPLYINYYPAAKAVINAGSSPWVHGILMEIKEHIGLIEPMLAFTIMAAVWGKSNGLIEDKTSRKYIFALMTIGAILAFIVMGMGAYGEPKYKDLILRSWRHIHNNALSYCS